MACGLTSDADYPDYLKRILKEINVGNDDALKNCACSLRTPTTDEGCPATDEDGKVGAFTSCIQTALDPANCPWTLKEAMAIYWRVRTWRFEVTGLQGETGEPGPIYPYSSTIDLVSSEEESDGDGNFIRLTNQKQLVCGNAFLNDHPDFRYFSYIYFGNPKKNGNLYTPGIFGEIQDETDGGTVYEFRVYPEYEIEPGGNTYDVDFSIFGKTIPMVVYYPYGGGGASLAFANVRATLTPIQYW